MAAPASSSARTDLMHVDQLQAETSDAGEETV